MCGLVAYFSLNNELSNEKKFYKALNSLSHRGPDDEGTELINLRDGELIIGHKRLSILDLKESGHQPMISPSGNLILSFNGEIYNYKELRDELVAKGEKFYSSTDTEVLLRHWEISGKNCLKKLKGMFAFAIFNKNSNTLTIVRDGFGIKPIYYKKEKDNLYIGSELKAIIELSNSRKDVNYLAAYDYLVQNTYDYSEITFFDKIFQLKPGHLIEFKLDKNLPFKEIKWWVPESNKILSLNFKDSSQLLRELFLENINLHLRSDVPFGAALSGGIDSSSIVCAMRYLNPQMPIHTFTYLDENKKINESYWANKVNNFVGAISHEVIVSPEDLINDLSNLINCQGEPFGSSSSYAQYRVYKEAQKNGIKVILDGQGADELFAGYNGYVGYRLLSLIEEFKIFKAFSFLKKWSTFPNRDIKLGIMDFGRITMPDKLYEFSRKKLGRDFKPKWLNYNFLEKFNIKYSERRDIFSKKYKKKRVLERLTNSITGRGLQGMLRSADRNSMHFSVESRLPFLTNNMAEMVFSLPENFLINDNGLTKAIFREAMKGIVPNEILFRKDKIGLETSQGIWLSKNSDKFRDEIINWAENDEAINSNQLLAFYDKNINNHKNSDLIWRIINYAFWYNRFIK